LIIGITGNSCLVSYALTDEFIFINETDHTIELYIWPHKIDGVGVSSLERRTVKVLPNSKSKIFSVPTRGSKEINPNLPQQFIQFSLGYERGQTSVFVDSTECFLFEETGFALASNYENEVFEGDRRVRHTYTFTNADFEIGKPCEEEENE
jgi:hypothetical protein